MVASRKTTRIVLIAVIGVAVVGAAGGAYLYRQSTLDRQALAARESGLAAFAKEDYPGTLAGLGRYLNRYQGRGATSIDYLTYAKARRRIEEPNGSHIIEAISMLQKAIALDPENDSARADLLELYMASGYATEALELIEKLIPARPADVELLRKKFRILEAMRQFPQALEVGRQVNAMAPDDLEFYFATLRVMRSTDASSQSVDEWTKAVIEAHRADPRFELLRVAALAKRPDPDSIRVANQTLDSILAADRRNWDPEFIATLATQLDNCARFSDSLSVLENAKDLPDASVRKSLLARLCFAGRMTEIVGHVERWGIEPASADPELLGMYAVALAGAGRDADAVPLRKQLAERTDRVGKAWSTLVEHTVATEKRNNRESVDALRLAVDAVPQSAVMRQALGEATALLGDRDGAIEWWNSASERAPSWARPLRLVARAHMAEPGSESLAVAAAQAAYLRAPQDLETITTLAIALARDNAQLNSARRAALLTIIDQIKTASPAAKSVLLPVQVSLLASADKSEAERLLGEQITNGAAADEATLMRLARVAGDAGLSIETDLLDAFEKAHGITAVLAVARASQAVRTGGADAGIAAFDRLRASPAAKGAVRDWDLARAGYLDSLGRPEAGPVWIALSESNPDDIGVQLGVLASPAVWTHREAMEKVIERIHVLAGESATTWRMARARWLLSSPNSDAVETAEAAQILTRVCQEVPKSLNARILLAQALERLGNLAGAEEQLQAASELSKDNAWIALELANLAQQQGHADVAKRHIDRALSLGDLGPETTGRAAYLLAVQGEFSRGVGLLEQQSADAAAKLERRGGTLLLAQMYAKLGRLDRSMALCQHLLESPTPEVIELASGLHAASGKPLEAEALLSRLSALKMPAGELELVRARHASHWDKPDVARSWFARAADAAPGRADVWKTYLDFGIRAGDAKTVEAILDDPRASAVEPVQFVNENRPELLYAVAEPTLRPMAAESLESGSARQAMLEAIRLTRTDWTDPAKRAATARSLRLLAEKNAGASSLQIYTAALSAQAGDVLAGAEIARRATAQFPDSVAAPWLSAEMLAHAGRWSDALEAGLEWRARAPSDDLRPELFVAHAMMQVGRVTDAAESLELRLPAALARSEEHKELINTYLVALVRTDRAARASDVLADLVRRSETWRVNPLGVPIDQCGDVRHAAVWLQMCAANVPASDPAVRLELARAWASGWQRFHAPEFLSQARDLFTELVSAPGVAGQAHLSLAKLAQQNGDLPSARREYEAALASDASLAEARNNLAWLLADTGEWERAVEEATRATKDDPASAEYRDTLAYAFAKGRQFDQARASLREAIQLDPANPKWHVSLAESLSEGGDAGNRAEAARALASVDALESQGAEVSNALRDRIDKVRAKIR